MGILLKSQYTIKQATAEDRLALANTPTKIYMGKYLDTVFEQKIEGDSIKNQGVHLVPLEEPNEQKGGIEFLPYDKLKPLIKKETTKSDPILERISPTSSDYSKAYFIRYFCLDNRIKVFTEISKNQSSYVDLHIYSLYPIKWNLSPTLGPKTNKKTVTRLKKLGSLKISSYDHIKDK
jgi:hypothetical protein